MIRRDHRLRLLAYLTIVFWTVIFLQPPIPQDLAYHQFADQRTLLGIPHCLNVLSNLPFLLVGLWGFGVVFQLATDPEQQAFVRPADSLAYQILFLGVALVGLGSTYYHLAPSNETLLWDRPADEHCLHGVSRYCDHRAPRPARWHYHLAAANRLRPFQRVVLALIPSRPEPAIFVITSSPRPTRFCLCPSWFACCHRHTRAGLISTSPACCICSRKPPRCLTKTSTRPED